MHLLVMNLLAARSRLRQERLEEERLETQLQVLEGRQGRDMVLRAAWVARLERRQSDLLVQRQDRLDRLSAAWDGDRVNLLVVDLRAAGSRDLLDDHLLVMLFLLLVMLLVLLNVDDLLLRRLLHLDRS